MFVNISPFRHSFWYLIKIIFFLVAVLLAVAVGQPSCEYTPYYDDNFAGVDLPNQPVSSQLSNSDECAAFCCTTPGCKAFTLNAGKPFTRSCFLKSSIGHVLNIGCVSGIMNGSHPIAPPTCALNNGTPCAPAPWPAQWNLTQSSCCYPDHETGYFVPPANQPWGLIPVSWTNAMNIWSKPNPFDGTCEAAMLEGCKRVKAVNKLTRCFRYNNMELAIAFLESNRAVMNAAHADWFLQYIDPATGKKNGTIYQEGNSMWFWDYSVPEVRDYVLKMIVNGVSDPAFDGTFTDDEIGFPVEHESAPAAMGMSDVQSGIVRYWAQVTSGLVIDALHSVGKYAFQAFFDGSYDGGNVGPAPTTDTCLSFMRAYCTPEFQKISITMALDVSNLNQTLAAFLLVRGPIAYIGFGWSSGQERWIPEFLWDVGTPQGLCSEVSHGVFVRPWSYGNVVLDCNTWKGTVPVKSP